MTQTDDNCSYFSLNNPSIINKPEPTITALFSTSKPKPNNLLNRRQQTAAAFFQPLELPSLPPLSQLLPSDKKQHLTNNNTTTIAEEGVSTMRMNYPTTTITANPSNIASVQQQQQQPIYYDNDENTITYPVTSTNLIPNNTTNSHHNNNQNNTVTTEVLMDPNSAAAAAAAAATTTTTTTTTAAAETAAAAAATTTTTTAGAQSSFPTTTNNDIMSINPNMYQLNPTTSVDPTAAMIAAAAAAISQSNYHNNTTQYYTNNPYSMNQSHQQTTRPRQLSNSSEKVYSFVAIPGTNQKKRPRRRYDEIERLYHCNWPGCSKAYGTLNHLNAHVSMQKHGPKRHPSEFKEMRKEWRRQKKAREAASKKRNNIDNNTVISQQQINGNDSMYRPNATTFQPQYTQIPTNTMSLNEFY